MVLTCALGWYLRPLFFPQLLLLLLLLFPHISPISRTRGHRRRLPFPYHRYIQKEKKKENERKKNNRRESLPRSDRRGGERKKQEQKKIHYVLHYLFKTLSSSLWRSCINMITTKIVQYTGHLLCGRLVKRMWTLVASLPRGSRQGTLLPPHKRRCHAERWCRVGPCAIRRIKIRVRRNTHQAHTTGKHDRF